MSSSASSDWEFLTRFFRCKRALLPALTPLFSRALNVFLSLAILLPPVSTTAVAALKQQYARVILIGSSLGGFYAHHLAEQFDLSCVLINPLVDAKLKMQELDESIAGALENPYTHNIFSIDDADKRAVENFATCSDAAKPLNKLILLQMADEVLDARLAARYYRQSPCIISAGGHHQFEHFERYSLTIFKWLGLC